MREISKKFLFELSAVIVAANVHPELLTPVVFPRESIVTEADSPSVNEPLQEPEIAASEAGVP